MAMPGTYAVVPATNKIVQEFADMLGVIASAALDNSRQRIVYTGDFKLGVNPTAGECPIIPCDVLVMEATFGSPSFHFPEQEQAVDLMRGFVEKCFGLQQTPVFLAYSLGKLKDNGMVAGGDAAKQTQWQGFVRKTRLDDVPKSLQSVIDELVAFLVPVAAAVESGSTFDRFWTAPGPWGPRRSAES